MPHVIVKMHEGRTEDQKRRLADAITRSVVEIAGCSEAAVSVAVEEYAPEAWPEAVYRRDILGRPASLIRPPGYNPFDG
jgi:4-oxalocrotonate tautomerase